MLRKKGTGPIGRDHSHGNGPEHTIIGCPVKSCRHKQLSAHGKQEQKKDQHRCIHKQNSEIPVLFRDQQIYKGCQGQNKQEFKSRIKFKDHKAFHENSEHFKPPFLND